MSREKLFTVEADLVAKFCELALAPSKNPRWTDHFAGFLSADPIKGGYIRNGRTPDLRAQHPRNWTEIEADFAKWSAGLSSPSIFSDGRAA